VDTGILTLQMPASPEQTDWRRHGVRIVRGGELDPNTPQTPGMSRAAAITTARAGAEKIGAGTVDIEAAASTGAHHHGPVESVIYVVSGRARNSARPPSASSSSPTPGRATSSSCRPTSRTRRSTRWPTRRCPACSLRSGQEPVVVNLDLPDAADEPERVRWVDDLHS